MSTDVNAAVKFKTKLPHAVRQMAERTAEIERKVREAAKTEALEEVAPTTTLEEEPSQVIEAKPVDVPPTQPDDYWERRAKVLDGMLKSQSEEFKKREKELNERLSAIESQAAKAAKVERQYDIRKYIPEAELELLDERQLGAAIKVATAAARDDIQAEIDERIKPLEQELKDARESSQKARESEFWNYISAKVPDAPELNVDQEFLAWLNQKAPYQRVDRLTLLHRAREQLDAESVVEFFEEFKALRASQRPAPRPAPSPQIDPVPSAPSTNGVAAPVITREQVRQFYSDVVKKRIKKDSREYELMNKKIAAATKAGTIID